MTKRNILTAMGIVLSFIIAVGGWVLTGRLMDVRSDMLMSATGATPIAMPMTVPLPAQDESQDEYVYLQPLLTEQEIVSILRNWEAPGRTIPHEPTREQINMEEAIAVGENWLSFIGELLSLSDEILIFDTITAHLSQNQQRTGNGFLPPAYSFWTVALSNRFINATMTINAVEGQVWKSEINTSRLLNPWFFQPREDYVAISPAHLKVNIDDITNALDTFISNIGIDADERSFIYDDGALTRLYRFFADDSAYAAVHISGLPFLIPNGESWLVSSISMQLSINNEL